MYQFLYIFCTSDSVPSLGVPIFKENANSVENY